MRTALNDRSVLDREDAVGLADGAQTVCDDEGRTALHQPQQGVLDVQLGARIDAAGGLIEDEDGVVSEDGPGDGK